MTFIGIVGYGPKNSLSAAAVNSDFRNSKVATMENYISTVVSGHLYLRIHFHSSHLFSVENKR